MAEEVKTSSTEKMAGTDGNLPDVVASLEMLTVTSASSDAIVPEKMTLRKRIRKIELKDKKGYTEVRNRRCSLRPKKRTSLEMESDDDVKGYYLDRNIRHKTNTLETIFEEPVFEGEEVKSSMSCRKFKRLIQFQTEPSDAKIKKRLARVKRIFGEKYRIKHRKSSMQTLINKLNLIKSDTTGKLTEETHQIAQVYEGARLCSLRP